MSTFKLSRVLPSSNDRENYEKIFKQSNGMCIIHKMIRARINTTDDWQIFTVPIGYYYPVAFDGSPCVIAQVNDDTGDSTFMSCVGVKRTYQKIETATFLRHKATTSDCWISLLIIGMLY